MGAWAGRNLSGGSLKKLDCTCGANLGWGRTGVRRVTSEYHNRSQITDHRKKKKDCNVVPYVSCAWPACSTASPPAATEPRPGRPMHRHHAGHGLETRPASIWLMPPRSRSLTCMLTVTVYHYLTPMLCRCLCVQCLRRRDRGQTCDETTEASDSMQEIESSSTRQQNN